MYITPDHRKFETIDLMITLQVLQLHKQV